MNQETLKQLLANKYDRSSWQSILTNIFGVRELHQKPRTIPLPKNDIAASTVELGSLETIDSRIVGIYEVELTDKPRIWQNRVGLRQLLRNVYHDVDAAIVVFVQADKWRLSLISEIRVRDQETGKVVEQKTEPKRYTYLLGKGETVRTAVDRLFELGKGFLSLDALIDAFSVEPLNKAFFREYKLVFDSLLAEVKPHVADDETARLFTQRLLNRLMFLYFIQKKGWMTFENDPNYLRRIFDDALTRGHDFYRDRLYYVFFYGLSNTAESKEIHNKAELEAIRGTLPYLNGGLFEPEKDGLDEKGKVPLANGRFGEVLGLFERYNFTIDESTPFEVQVAVDPEMLGKVFEELVTGRHESGSYYTPRTVVSFMCREALKHALAGTDTSEAITKLVDQNDGRNITDPEKVLNRLRDLKICDPACGSGAYLLGMLQELLHVREALFASTAIAKDAQYKWKREIIENNIYGVDLDRFATQIAALRLWLSLAIESEEPHPLPNLKYKIGCGDSLLAPIEAVGQTPDLHRRALIEQFRARKKEYTDADSHLEKAEAEAEIERLRVEIARTLHHLPEPPSPAKLILARNSVEPLRSKIQEGVRGGNKALAETNQKKLDSLLADIAKWEAEQTVDHYDTKNVFDWSVEFADVFEEGGFDVVLANPPYIQLQRMGAIADKYASAGFETFARTGDIYCLFYELGQKLLKPNGVVCYITSNKWMRAAYGANTRQFFAEKTNPILLIDFAGQQIFEGATVDTNILMFSKTANEQKTLACVMKEDALNNLSVFVRQSGYESEFVSKQSWVILSEIEQRIKSKIESIGTPLRDWNISIYRGVLTGYNDAFIIDGETRNALIKADPKSDEIIRPVLRGRDIKRYSYQFADLYLIATFPSKHYDIDRYPAIKEHLLGFGYDRLKQTGGSGARKKTNNKWFETQDSIGYWEDFYRPKIVWGEISDKSNFALDIHGKYFINNKCYLMTGNQLEYLVCFLNSYLSEYLFSKIATTTGVGTAQWSKFTIEQLCIPFVTKEQESDFVSLLSKLKASKITEADINFRIYEICDLTLEEIAFIESKTLLQS